MNTEVKKKKRAGIFLLPAAMALPIIGLLAAVILRYGQMIRKLVSVLIKLAVKA